MRFVCLQFTHPYIVSFMCAARIPIEVTANYNLYQEDTVEIHPRAIKQTSTQALAQTYRRFRFSIPPDLHVCATWEEM